MGLTTVQRYCAACDMALISSWYWCPGQQVASLPKAVVNQSMPISVVRCSGRFLLCSKRVASWRRVVRHRETHNVVGLESIYMYITMFMGTVYSRPPIRMSSTRIIMGRVIVDTREHGSCQPAVNDNGVIIITFRVRRSRGEMYYYISK